jgi:hypothetical protein
MFIAPEQGLGGGPPAVHITLLVIHPVAAPQAEFVWVKKRTCPVNVAVHVTVPVPQTIGAFAVVAIVI